MRFLLFTALVVGCSADILAVDCTAKVDRGKACSGKKESIRYHFDGETSSCLAFSYKGCGGNGNNFELVNACHNSCRAIDETGCPANSAPVKGKDGQLTGCNINQIDVPFIEGEPVTTPAPEGGCPKGSVCNAGHHGIGPCCDASSSKKLDDDYNPNCGTGKTHVTVKHSGFEQTLLGKSCASGHCPKGSTCKQGNFFAYCCK